MIRVKDKVISIRLNQEELEKLVQLSNENEMSNSAMVRYLINQA